MHRVIDELDMDVTVLEEDADGKAFSDLLKATMAGGDRRLRALGFDITSILHVAGGAPPRAWLESPMICFARPTPTSRVTPSPAAKPTCR